MQIGRWLPRTLRLELGWNSSDAVVLPPPGMPLPAADGPSKPQRAVDITKAVAPQSPDSGAISAGHLGRVLS